MTNIGQAEPGFRIRVRIAADVNTTRRPPVIANA
jgi:hypothetical protein